MGALGTWVWMDGSGFSGGLDEDGVFDAGFLGIGVEAAMGGALVGLVAAADDERRGVGREKGEM